MGKIKNGWYVLKRQNPALHRGRGWLHCFFYVILLYILFSCNQADFWVCERETLFVSIYRDIAIYSQLLGLYLFMKGVWVRKFQNSILSDPDPFLFSPDILMIVRIVSGMVRIDYDLVMWWFVLVWWFGLLVPRRDDEGTLEPRNSPGRAGLPGREQHGVGQLAHQLRHRGHGIYLPLPDRHVQGLGPDNGRRDRLKRCESRENRTPISMENIIVSSSQPSPFGL